MKLATKTLELLEETLVKDQGNKYRHFLAIVMPHMADSYRQEDDGFRSHLGASLMGHECDRALWYGFRWHVKPKFSGKTLLLFNRGHIEEGRIIALLLAARIGVYQSDTDGKQYQINYFGGHFGGSGDGIADDIPDVPIGEKCLLEFKTHSEQSFRKLSSGIEKSNPRHYVQMQLYMGGMGLKYGLYLAVNKNTDELYGEVIEYNEMVDNRFIERAEGIIFASKAPPKINENPSWFQCKYCDFRGVCHNQEVPEMNCRTCCYSDPYDDGDWYCRYHQKALDKTAQLQGCNNHDFIR
jgi:hypothetical protein